MSTNSYAIQVQGREAKSSDGMVVGSEGAWYWVLKDVEGWVEATSIEVGSPFVSSGEIPAHIKTFATPSEAEQFARRWKGHPWWCEPNGEFKVFAVSPVTATQVVGYRRA